jgi:hypothetical protein
MDQFEKLADLGFRHHAFREIGVVEIESEWTGRDRERSIDGGPAPIFLDPG